jgi:dUTPase
MATDGCPVTAAQRSDWLRHRSDWETVARRLAKLVNEGLSMGIDDHWKVHARSTLARYHELQKGR